MKMLKILYSDRTWEGAPVEKDKDGNYQLCDDLYTLMDKLWDCKEAYDKLVNYMLDNAENGGSIDIKRDTAEFMLTEYTYPEAHVPIDKRVMVITYDDTEFDTVTLFDGVPVDDMPKTLSDIFGDKAESVWAFMIANLDDIEHIETCWGQSITFYSEDYYK